MKGTAERAVCRTSWNKPAGTASRSARLARRSSLDGPLGIGFRWVTVGLLFLALGLPVSAATEIELDAHFTWKRGEEGSRTERHRYTLGTDRARLDQPPEAYLVDRAAGTYAYLDLEDRHVIRVASPIDPLAKVPAAFREEAKKQLGERMPQGVRVSRTGETRTIAGFEAEHVIITAGGAGEPVTARFDLWVSPKLWKLVEPTAYWRLESDRLKTSPYTSWLVEPLRSLEAMPVQAHVVMELRGGKLHTEYTRTLVSVETGVEVPEETYQVPEGFTPFPRSSSGFVTPTKPAPH